MASKQRVRIAVGAGLLALVAGVVIYFVWRSDRWSEGTLRSHFEANVRAKSPGWESITLARSQQYGSLYFVEATHRHPRYGSFIFSFQAPCTGYESPKYLGIEGKHVTYPVRSSFQFGKGGLTFEVTSANDEELVVWLRQKARDLAVSFYDSLPG